MTAPTEAQLRLRRLAAFVAVVTLVSMAVQLAAAQAAPDITNPATWFLSVASWGVIASFLTTTLRTNVLPNVKGAGAIALAFAVSIAGALVANTGWFGRIGIDLPGNLWDAVLFGVMSGAVALGWWDGSTALARKAGEANAQAQIKAALVLEPAKAANAALIAAPFAAVNPESLTDYLLGLIRARFGANVPAFAWSVLATLTAEFAGKVLTPEIRTAIQHRLLDLLVAAGAGGQDL